MGMVLSTEHSKLIKCKSLNMNSKTFNKYIVSLFFILYGIASLAQTVPMGVSYQAVARDNYGKELANKEINVRFSIISGNPQGPLVYQELHSGIITSKYGVFSLVIGKGVPTGGTAGALSEIKWELAVHYLKVEIKFENDYVDMGTMQFLAVPYALYAQRSLEPGPQGPKGETGSQGIQGVQGQKGNPGDPATDDQVLSFDGTNLSISGGNTLNISTLNTPHNLTLAGNSLTIMGGNTVVLPDQNQDLTLDANNKLKVTNNPAATEVDLTKYNQTINFNTSSNVLSISGGTSTADLSSLKNDADSDPLNEIQDLKLTGDILTITNKTTPQNIDLGPYRDNTDSQTLTYIQSSNSLNISGGNSVSLGSMVAFRARKTVEETGLSINTDYDFVTPTIDYNDGGGLDLGGTLFTAPSAGIYTFIVGYIAGSNGDSKSLKLFLNGFLYETLNTGITMGSSLTRAITLKLVKDDKVKIVFSIGSNITSPGSGTGSFSGYKVY